LYVVVQDAWMKNHTAAFLMFNTAITRFMLQSRRFNAVILSWENVTPTVDVPIRRYLQAVYNNRPRFRISDYSVFGAKRDKWGRTDYGDSLLNRLRAYRLKQQIEPSSMADALEGAS
jgi:hypothetical protein